MALVVYSVVRRHMKLTSERSFTVSDGTSDVPARLPLTPDESVIGWYRNPEPWSTNLVVFTSHCIYIVDVERIDQIPIKDIVGYETPKMKDGVTGVRVITRSGFHFVRVAGRFGPNGNRKDAYSFIMVLRALISGNAQADTNRGNDGCVQCALDED